MNPSILPPALVWCCRTSMIPWPTFSVALILRCTELNAKGGTGSAYSSLMELGAEVAEQTPSLNKA
ncbi:hypothetical protein NMYAN_10017 [Nitrosomonas nitrosa]|uniref:Uncharacterized protein n=1 Tax=Nitrosomonas nitrosa TaxID=52442 RepID=A0A8H9D877_9PROT|nr:hypothetical protein NMYAN_10017 [Nitrosomonas nitrosa]